ncbi:hypothetical protein BDZ94DRAFT_1245503 [Collybia nuda]|uniref:ABM domain-containing protein n=1 Tax=Collybia nuda TaxID=64659 RepID=A0A9P5YEH1_9AGAR|nr:hypothetical protein BDZ94DRAFT_1245503 [Collybia nuda]
MPIVEVVTFPGSDTFIKDQAVSRAVLERLARAEGFISTHNGLQFEDGRTGYLIVVWESYEHHKRLMEHEDYGGLVQSLISSTSGNLEMQHIDFDGDSTLALTSPATEFVTFKAKPNSEEKLVSAFKRLAGELIKASSCHCVVFGESREHKGTFMTAIGWDSVEAHQKTVEDEALKAIIDDLYAAADLEIRHTSLVQFSA